MKFTLIALCCMIMQSIHGHNDESFRIVGGQDAAIAIAPYMCGLKISVGFGSFASCGCSILSNKWVLSAAHCIQGKLAKNTKVLVGTNHFSDDENKQSHEKSRKYYGVAQWIGHQHWDRNKVINDVAVIQVEGVIEFNAHVKPIKFSTNRVPLLANVRITGWGRTGTNSRTSSRLQILNSTTVDCAGTRYRNIDDQHLCTLTKRGQGNCRGDSGGPLVWNNEVVGVVSYGSKECANGRADVFARVSYYHDWIREQIRHK